MEWDTLAQIFHCYIACLYIYRQIILRQRLQNVWQMTKWLANHMRARKWMEEMTTGLTMGDNNTVRNGRRNDIRSLVTAHWTEKKRDGDCDWFGGATNDSVAFLSLAWFWVCVKVTNLNLVERLVHCGWIDLSMGWETWLLTGPGRIQRCMNE